MAYVIATDGLIQIILSRPPAFNNAHQIVQSLEAAIIVERGVPGSDEAPYPTTGTYIPQFRLYRQPLTESDFAVEDSLVGTTVPLIWVEIALADGTYVYAKVDLPDPASYYGGWKEGRLLSIGGVKRALSDRLGNYEAAQFSFNLSDHDRFIRAKLGGAGTKWFMNRFVTMRMISDQGRRALLVPRIIAIGYLRDYAPISPLQFTITAEDYLALFVGLGENEKQIPKRTISRVDLTDCPLDQVGKPIPIIYGVVSDETSTTTPPTLRGTSGLGSYVQDGVRICGFGPMGVLSAPTNVQVSLSALGAAPSTPTGLGYTIHGTPGATTYKYAVTAYNANGESAKTADLTVTNGPATLDGTNWIELSWSSSAGATGYVVYGRSSTATWLDEAGGSGASPTQYFDGADQDVEKTGTPISVGLSTDVPNGEYAVIVVAVDSNGNCSDPSTYYWNAENGGRGSWTTGVTFTPTANQKATVTWNAVSGASKYRVYLGWYYYGGRWTQYIEVTAPTVTCVFDRNPGWQKYPIVSGDFSTGALQPNFGERHQYKVAAVMVDGETGLSAFGYSTVDPYRRKARVEWNAVAGAVEYRVYRFDGFGNFEGRQWTVSGSQTYFDDDLLDTNVVFLTQIPAATGAVPLVPVGTEVDAGGARWYRFLVAGHAVKAIDSVFLDGVKVDSGNFGVTWAVPGKTGYSTYFPNTGSPQYRDLNGRRYTFVYVRGPDGDAAGSGQKKITANVQGVEDTGDGGGTLLTDGFDCYLHAMRNWILGDYQSGAWASSGPTWPSAFGAAAVEVLDDASFAAAKAIAQTRITGGYQANFIIGANGEIQTTRTWIQRFNVSLDCYAGFSRKSQFFVRLIDPTIEVLAAARQYTQVLDIFANSFQTVDAVRDLENVVVYSYWRNYAANSWLKEAQELSDTDSITNSQQTKRSQTVEQWLSRSATQSEDVANRRLLRTKEPPRTVRWRSGLQALNTELGDIVKVTHLEGVGTGGWTDRPIFVTRHELDPDTLSITLEGIDVDRLFQGAFILGDETVLPADWDDADATERAYGYLADETTGTFTNGDPIKRLR